MKNKMKKNKVISADQKLKIQSKCMKRNLMFSQFADELEDRKLDDLSDGLLLNLSLSGKKSSASTAKIQKKRAIQENIFAIKNKSCSIADLLRANADRSPNELKPSVSSQKQRIKQQQSNTDLYAKTICKQLRLKDVRFVRQLINILTADIAFKLSSRVFKEEVIERRTNENEYNELELFERFLQLIQLDKNISERMKNCVLNHARSLNRSKLPRNKRQKQKFIQERGFRTVHPLKLGLDKLTLGNGIGDDAKPKKEFAFK